MIVNFDEIEINSIDYGGGNVYYYNNKPFSGVIVEYNSDGILIGEITVLNGSKHGRCALYYDSGQIQEEFFISYNRPYGLLKEWAEDGSLINEIDFGDEHQPA